MDKPIPDWFTSERDFYSQYGHWWGFIFYALTALAIIAPVVAWLLSNTAPGNAGAPQRIWKLVGFWTAIATVATGFNTTFTPGVKADNAWNARDYLDIAMIQYRTNESNRNERYLGDAAKVAREIFSRRQAPQKPAETQVSDVNGANHGSAGVSTINAAPDKMQKADATKLAK